MSDASDFVIENGVLIKYVGPGGDVVIPEGVTKIGESAFEREWEVTSITVPNQVTQIGKSAFSLCRNLTNIILPVNLEKLEAYTFSFCSKLTEVILPDNIEEIEENAFYGCSNDLVVHYGGKQYKKIPKAIRDRAVLLWLKGEISFSKAQTEYIKKEAFHNRKKLIDTGEDNGVLMSRLLSCGKWKLEDLVACIDCINDGQHPSMIAALLAAKNKAFPNAGVVQEPVADALFAPYSEENVKKSWTYIKDKKVGGYKITGYIGTEVFPIMPECIGDVPVVSTSEDAFRGCKFVGIQLPDTLKKLGNLCFAHCSNLEELVLPDGLEALPSLFLGCTNLKKVSLPKKLHWVGDAVFPAHYDGGCSYLDNFKYEPANYQLEEICIDGENPWFTTPGGVLIDKEKWNILHFPAKKEEFIVPDTVTKIGAGTFAHTSLKEITLHDKIKVIGNGAFCGCVNLKEVVIPQGATKELGDYVFRGCTNLERVQIPKCVKKIGAQVFGECPNLTIYAPAGSYAETYAKEHNIPFEAE